MKNKGLKYAHLYLTRKSNRYEPEYAYMIHDKNNFLWLPSHDVSILNLYISIQITKDNQSYICK